LVVENRVDPSRLCGRWFLRLWVNGENGVLGVEGRCFLLKQLSGICTKLVHFDQKLIFKQMQNCGVTNEKS
jgi:hypothetical protein